MSSDQTAHVLPSEASRSYKEGVSPPPPRLKVLMHSLPTDEHGAQTPTSDWDKILRAVAPLSYCGHDMAPTDILAGFDFSLKNGCFQLRKKH